MEEAISGLRDKLADGVSPAMATPLEAGSYEVKISAVPDLVNFLVEREVKGLFVGGTTGEGILLDLAERKRLHEAAIDAAAGRVAVLLHVGAHRTDMAVALARHAASLGADGIAAVTPYFYGIHDDGLLAYYEAIAAAVPDVPLFGYDIPHMAVNGINPMLAARLFNAIPSFAGMKTSHTDVQVVRRLLDATPENRIVLVGNESAALGSLALGADGLISGLSTAIPEPFVALTRAFAAGDLEEARRQQRLINRLLLHLPAGKRIGAIKAILVARGVAVGEAVPTLPQPSADFWPAMQELLEHEITAV